MNILGTDAERHILVGIEILVEILDSRNDALGKQNLVSADEAHINLIPFGNEAEF